MSIWQIVWKFLLDDEDILKMIKLLEIMDKEDLQGLLRLGDKFVNAK